jgi:hypothetical protein
MNTKSQLVCAWCSIGFAVVFTIGLWPLAQFLPPMSPALSAVEIAAIYRENTLPIRFGTLIMMFGCALMIPFLAVIATQMKRIEGEHSVLTVAQISGGTIGVVVFLVATVAWTTAAFRPDRSPELIMLLNDFGWIFLLMTFGTFVIQDFALGFAILGDKRPDPIFPRWLGFFSIWVGVLFMPGGLLTFFKTGPFSWNGIFVWWVPFLTFFAWYIVMFVMVRSAVLKQAESEA